MIQEEIIKKNNNTTTTTTEITNKMKSSIVHPSKKRIHKIQKESEYSVLHNVRNSCV